MHVTLPLGLGRALEMRIVSERMLNRVVFRGSNAALLLLLIVSTVSVYAESAKALLSGGIEFATPTEAEAAVTNGAAFRLYDKPEEAWKNWVPAIQLNLPAQAPETAGTGVGGAMTGAGRSPETVLPGQK